MATTRITINVDSQVAEEIREAAARAGVSTSAWFASAAERRLKNQLLGEWLDEYEAEHGAFTQDELAEADKMFQRAEVLGDEARRQASRAS